jgi:transcription elongation factor GreA
MENYLTPEGLKKLKKELDTLENVTRRELAEKSNYAISFGDLKENAAYHQAKEQQGFAEGRIAELKAIIANAKITEKGGNDKVRLGSTVILLCGGAKEKYVIVGPDEADIFAGKVSYRSPLGKAVLGKKPGDKVILKTPGGKIAYEIKEII